MLVLLRAAVVVDAVIKLISFIYNSIYMRANLLLLLSKTTEQHNKWGGRFLKTFSKELSIIMAAQSAATLSAAGSSSSPLLSARKKKHGLFVLSVLFLLGFVFVSFRVLTTDASLCEEKQQRKKNRLETNVMREEETIGDDDDDDDDSDDENTKNTKNDKNGEERDGFVFSSSSGIMNKKRGGEELDVSTTTTKTAAQNNDGVEEEEEEEEEVGEDNDAKKSRTGTEDEDEDGKGSSNTKKRSRRGPSGCTPNRVREFTAEALKNPKGGDSSETTTSKVWLDAFGDDLAKRYNFTTCAVVGNSGSLLRPPRLNNDIDEHEVVIRLNAAPTSGRYGQRVGRKTTLRFLNAARAKTYLVGGCSKTMPCDEGSTLVATRGMPFAPSKVITNAHLSIVRGRRLDLGEGEEEEENPQRQKRKAAMEAQVLKMSEPERERLSVAQPPSNSMGAVKRVMKAYKSAYVEKCGEDDAKRLFKGPDTPSTGFMAVIFALHMCSETVSVYGFKKQLKPYQYFRMRVKPSEVHDFTVEAEILKAMAKDGVLRMPGVVQDRIRKSGSSSVSIDSESSSSVKKSSSSSSSSSSDSLEKEDDDASEKENADEWFENFVSSSN